ncbi:MAG: DUF2949 domain-containing protein [Symploca sp. SIO3C6]|uniref:DUF2949 domain-containing protein n=1 Tax=Symploca sp. SIO1C4 TaxID=2607765 RepID=A0A6B3NBJ9_9CYAN|nr:DUF2949 domain-containing protein [Symploca sp. SIO3C6]NER26558.1 DUF2949 domain-containing protein [Symploca sp. SIO1C4]
MLQAKLIDFLQQELSLSADSIALALRQGELTPYLLPMILWQYGLVNLKQLDQIFDWLEAA